MKPDLSLYLGRRVTDVIFDPQNTSDWYIQLEGGARIINKSQGETMVPGTEIVGTVFKSISMSLRDTILRFQADNGHMHQVSFTPTYYTIHDPAHGGEVYPQWPEELEEQGYPATPEGGISDKPSPQWVSEEERLANAMERRHLDDAHAFLKEDTDGEG